MSLEEDLDKRGFYEHLVRIGWTTQQLYDKGLAEPWVMEQRAKDKAQARHILEQHKAAAADSPIAKDRLPRYPQEAYLRTTTPEFAAEQNRMELRGDCASKKQTDECMRLVKVAGGGSNL